jgi:hypothetical protein
MRMDLHQRGWEGKKIQRLEYHERRAVPIKASLLRDDDDAAVDDEQCLRTFDIW